MCDWFRTRGIYRTDGDTVAIQIPDVRQRDDYDCGPAAIDAGLRAIGSSIRRFPELANPIQGLAPDTVEAVLRAGGLPVLSGTMTIEDLRHLTRSGRPVFCPILRGGCGHWVTVAGIVKTRGPARVVFQCPIDGPCRMPVPTWLEQWQDVGRSGQRFYRWGICPGMP